MAYCFLPFWNNLILNYLNLLQKEILWRLDETNKYVWSLLSHSWRQRCSFSFSHQTKSLICESCVWWNQNYYGKYVRNVLEVVHIWKFDINGISPQKFYIFTTWKMFWLKFYIFTYRILRTIFHTSYRSKIVVRT